MYQTSHPTPAQVREWMQKRQTEHKPPPTPEEIRRELGWEMNQPTTNRSRT